jgi:hypothetical protein
MLRSATVARYDAGARLPLADDSLRCVLSGRISVASQPAAADGCTPVATPAADAHQAHAPAIAPARPSVSAATGEAGHATNSSLLLTPPLLHPNTAAGTGIPSEWGAASLVSSWATRSATPQTSPSACPDDPARPPWAALAGTPDPTGPSEPQTSGFGSRCSTPAAQGSSANHTCEVSLAGALPGALPCVAALVFCCHSAQSLSCSLLQYATHALPAGDMFARPVYAHNVPFPLPA